MSRRLRQILGYVSGMPWAIHEAAAQRMMAVLERRIEGTRLSQAEIDAAVGADREAYAARREVAADRSARGGGGIAVVPVYGTILGRDWEFTQASHGGTTSAESLMRTLVQLDADETVGTVVLDIDSPGGSVGNLPELATQIAGMRTHVVAQVNLMAASAAYWLASQADEIVVSPSGEVGSIGVYTMHVDQRESLAQEGVSVEIIRAGENKIAANPFEELSDEARADIQGNVDDYHAMFVAAVAKGRGVSPKAVRSEFGDGKMFHAKDAVRRGMADRVATLDETLVRASRRRSSGRMAAANTPIETTASEAKWEERETRNPAAVDEGDTEHDRDEARKRNAIFAFLGTRQEPSGASGMEIVSAVIAAFEGEATNPGEVTDDADEIEIRKRRLAY